MDRTGRRYTQFKGIKSYKDIVSLNEKLLTAYKKIIESSKASYQIKGKINDIDIDEDWIIKIEEYLPYISNCIQENRKFIKNNGETVPIEKVKRVGRESIVDLSMHSKNIRTINDNNEIEPSKLLVVEKLDDYSVYENKFLFFLLNYLKSFVEIRFDKIKEAKSLYQTKTSLNNDVNLFRNQVSFNIEINDKRFRDLNLEENDKNTPIIQRIRNIEVVINQLLHTELIEQVSKTPSIKPPIQKTNVLKNDVNFSRSVELYEFINNYSKPGFEIRPIETVKNELSNEYLGYFSMIPTLLAFLSYAEIKDLFSVYEEEFKKEIVDLRELELEKSLRKIREMIGKDDLDVKLIYSYIINMEDEKIFLDNKIKELEIKLVEEINALNEKHENEIVNLNENHANEINELNACHINEINELKHSQEEQNKIYEEEIHSLKIKFNDEVTKLNAQVNELTQTIKSLEYQNKETEARLKAEQISHDNNFEENENSIDYFNALEEQKKIFDKYFDRKWTQVKKEIMKDEKKKAINQVKEKKTKRKEKNK